ncbi:hypothetical protein F5888DRAFT_1735991 [Russula emetica]|nr:hypothetical protein F5888DRAFT_1735991 [Russula emetica]
MGPHSTPVGVLKLQSINIITTDDKTSSVPNPFKLYQYTFNPVDRSFPSPRNGLKTTVRDPAPNTSSMTNIQRLTRYDVSFPATSFRLLSFTSAILTCIMGLAASVQTKGAEN